MTETLSPSATWDAWTVEQRTEWLATVVMGWRKHIHRFPEFHIKHPSEEKLLWWDGSQEYGHEWAATVGDWNPLSSWDDWRRVEEKVMEDEKLWVEFLVQIWSVPATLDVMQYADEVVAMGDLMKADLPTRAKALYLAYESRR